ncbi:MAG: methyltransferase domain-containing protein [Clostridiaceae bacterium]|nr:methyltransferase domain-containing protein [Clostridiaceae bacterium]
MSVSTIENNIGIFKCPVCNESMTLNEKSMVCEKYHCFDISKTGYINLLLNSKKQPYDKELFISRDFVCHMGFFDPLIKELVSLINSKINHYKDKANILDAGCGEGFHLAQIMKKLNETSEINSQGFGTDISKEGIQIASKKYKNIVWCVSDLARTPYKDGKFDIILNILSPSNYGEFERLLTNTGFLIKVVPGKEYLKELRRTFYEETEKERYSNSKVINHFEKNFSLVNLQKVNYTVPVNKEELAHLIKMTPLSWGAERLKVQQALSSEISSITADFSVLLGKRKEKNE